VRRRRAREQREADRALRNRHRCGRQGVLRGPRVRPPTIAVEWSPTAGWVEVDRNGELHSEWNEARDGDLYRVLDQFLRDDPALYQPAPPGEEPPGRGPVLQERELLTARRSGE
jgi:hypothetical protein